METFSSILAFFNSYPTYVKGAFFGWFILGALLVGLLVFTPRIDPSGLLFVDDINALWAPLMKDIKARTDPQEKRLTVFGLTLYAAWNELRPWLIESSTQGWEVDFYCLAPDAASRDYKSFLEPKWFTDSTNRISEINKFLTDYATTLNSRHMTIRLHTYNSFPTVHGFVLGSGKIYMSHTQWSEQSRLLDYGPHPYEIIEKDDRTERAKAYRDLFYNWLDRANHPPASLVP